MYITHFLYSNQFFATHTRAHISTTHDFGINVVVFSNYDNTNVMTLVQSKVKT